MLAWGALVVGGSFLTFGLLLLPGALTGNPGLKLLCPLLGSVLVTGCFWPTFGRALVICAGSALYVVAVTLVMKLVTAPFGGGAPTLDLTGRAIAAAVQGVLALPLFGYLAATTLVSYAELRFRDDPVTTTRTLAASL